jgi:hypothetical protein
MEREQLSLALVDGDRHIVAHQIDHRHLPLVQDREVETYEDPVPQLVACDGLRFDARQLGTEGGLVGRVPDHETGCLGRHLALMLDDEVERVAARHEIGRERAGNGRLYPPLEVLAMHFERTAGNLEVPDVEGEVLIAHAREHALSLVSCHELERYCGLAQGDGIGPDMVRDRRYDAGDELWDVAARRSA